MKAHCALLCLSLLGVVSSSLAAQPEATKPNMLFLLSDDHSYPYLSCYGSPNVKTPTIDRLAAEGMKFHRFFTGAPQCVPSRATLMTGRSPVAARITRFSSPLHRDEIIFPEILREKAGYFTGVCGRNYHLDGSARIGDAVARVFQEHKLQTFAERMDYVTTGGDIQVAGQVAEFLDKKPADKPFFLWANFSDPHHPWNAPASDRPDPAALKLPAQWPDLPGVREQFADYCAEINRLDRSVQERSRRALATGTARGDAHRIRRRQWDGAAAWQGFAVRSRLQRTVPGTLARNSESRR